METPEETERFFDVTSASKIGLCLDTGHCAYAGGDSASEAEKYREILRFVHIKDVDQKVLAEVRRQEMNFEQAMRLMCSLSLARDRLISPDSFVF